MVIESFCFMKTNFENMTKAQLRNYVLENREDMEALRILMNRRNPNSIEHNFPNTEEGREQIQEVIKRKIEAKS
jgi:nucleoside diphosphate kinase